MSVTFLWQMEEMSKGKFGALEPLSCWQDWVTSRAAVEENLQNSGPQGSFHKASSWLQIQGFLPLTESIINTSDSLTTFWDNLVMVRRGKKRKSSCLPIFIFIGIFFTVELFKFFIYSEYTSVMRYFCKCFSYSLGYLCKIIFL